MVGAAQRILDLAVEHAKTRVQSGRPIGAFQAIQHACADLARGVESARPLVLHAAWKAQEGRPCETDIAMAKSYAGDACLAVARKAHQVFGAIGYCDEHPLHRLHKQIIAARLAYGDTASPRGDDRPRHRPDRRLKRPICAGTPPSAAGSTYREYASPAAFGRRASHLDLFEPPAGF